VEDLPAAGTVDARGFDDVQGSALQAREQDEHP